MDYFQDGENSLKLENGAKQRKDGRSSRRNIYGYSEKKVYTRYFSSLLVKIACLHIFLYRVYSLPL